MSRSVVEAILPNINSHQTDIEIYPAVMCHVKSNENVILLSEGKNIDNFTFRSSWVVTIYKCSMPLVCLSRMNFN